MVVETKLASVFCLVGLELARGDIGGAGGRVSHCPRLTSEIMGWDEGPPTILSARWAEWEG